MIVRDRSGFTLEPPPSRSLTIDAPFVSLVNCHDFEISGDWIGQGAGRAIELTDCSGFKIGARLSGWHRAVVLKRVADGSVANCLFEGLRSDGVNLQQGERITIDANTFRDFAPVGDDHGDAIWVSTQAGRWPVGPSRDIRITRNRIDAAGCNSIFVVSPSGERHSGITIERNLVLAGTPNGIMLSCADASAVRFNVVAGQGQHIRLNDAKADVRGNVAPAWEVNGKWQSSAPVGNVRAV